MLQENCNSQDFCIFPSSLHPFLAPCIYSQLPTFFPKSLLLSPSPCIFFLAPCIFANSAFPAPPVLCIFPHLPASFSIFLHFPLALPASFPSSASFPGSLRIFPALYIFSQIPAFSPPAPCIFPLLPACFPCSQHVSPVPLIFPLLPASFPTSLHLSPSQQPGTIQIPAPSPPSLPRAGAAAPGSACHLCCPACPSHLCPSGTWLRELLMPCTRLLQSQHEAMLDFFFFFFLLFPCVDKPSLWVNNE